MKKNKLPEEVALDILTYRFEQFLLGSDTKRYRFTSLNQKQKFVCTIKDYSKFRLEDKLINRNSEIWKIILKINKSNLKNLKEIKEIFSELYKLINKDKKHTIYNNYYKQKGREIKR